MNLNSVSEIVNEGMQFFKKAISNCKGSEPASLFKDFSYDKKQISKRMICERLCVSFGVWNILASMMAQNEFVKLQGLNHFAYDVNISRC